MITCGHRNPAAIIDYGAVGAHNLEVHLRRSELSLVNSSSLRLSDFQALFSEAANAAIPLIQARNKAGLKPGLKPGFRPSPSFQILSIIPSPLRGRVRPFLSLPKEWGVKSSHQQPPEQRTMANPVNPKILRILIQTNNRMTLAQPSAAPCRPDNLSVQLFYALNHKNPPFNPPLRPKWDALGHYGTEIKNSP